MNISVKKIALNEQQTAEGHAINPQYLGLVGDIQVHCSVRIGSLSLSIAELKKLHTGQMLALDQKTDEPVEVFLNDKLIARGELMSYEEHFAIRIMELG